MSEPDRPSGQERMVKRIMGQIREQTSVLTFPMNERIIIYPVVVEEERLVEVVRFSKELAEMGVVFYVSYGANREQLELLRHLESELAQATANPVRKSIREQMKAIQETGLIEVGDVVAVNKFSGMDVPGSQFIAIHREDVLTKLVGLPVRLRTDDDRPDDGRKEALRREARLSEQGIERVAGGLASPK